MKNLIFNTLIAVLFSTISLTASTPAIIIDGSKSFVVDANNWKSSTVDVRIKNENGITFFTDQQVLTTSKRYSLENLDAGNYTVTISNDIKIVENKITISNDGLILDFQANTIFKPVFNINDDIIDINYLTEGLDTKIYFQDNENTIFRTKLVNATSVNKRFNISNLPSGDYSITVSNKNGSFFKTFSK